MIRFFQWGLVCKYVAGFLLVLTSICHAESKSDKLDIYLYDEDNHKPIAGAKWYINLGNNGTSQDSGKTEADGLIHLHDITQSKIQVYIVAKHFNTIDTLILIGDKSTIQILMLHGNDAAIEVEVHADQTKDIDAQPGQQLSNLELISTRSLGIAQTLANIPGVTLIATGSTIAKPQIDGLQGNRVIILNNGIRQEGQQWGNEHAPEIDPYIAKHMKVLRGAGAIRYAHDAIGGVIFVEPDTLAFRSRQAELNLGGGSNNGMGAVSLQQSSYIMLGRLAYRVQGTTKRSGTVHSPDYYQKNTGSAEYNGSLALGYVEGRHKLEFFGSYFYTKLGIFSASHIGNVTDLYQAIASDRPAETSNFNYTISRPYQAVDHSLFKLQYDYNLPDSQWHISVTVAHQNNHRQEYDKHLPRNNTKAALNLPELDYSIASSSVDANLDYRVRGWRHSLGISTMYQANTWSGRFFIPNYETYRAGIWANSHYTKNKWDVEAGLRTDYRQLNAYYYQGNDLLQPSNNWQNVALQLGGKYRITPNLHLLANVGTAWRPPAANELYSNGLHHGAATIEIGNAGLNSEYATTYSTGIHLNNYYRFSADVIASINQINSYINLVPTLPATLTIRGAFPTFNYIQQNALLRSISGTLLYHLSESFNLKLNASILRGTDRNTKLWIAQLPADRFSSSVNYVLVHSRGRLQSAGINLSITHVARMWRLTANEDYSPAPDAYTTLNVGANALLKLGKRSIELNLSVDNLTNTRYRDYLDRFRYFTDAMGRNVRLNLRLPLYN